MKIMRRKKIAVAVSMLMCISLLTGCGSTSTGETETTDTVSETVEATEADSETIAAEENESEAVISGELNIAVFQGGYGADYWYEVIEMFEEKYPEVTVEMTISPQVGEMIKPQVVAGNVPDFLSLNASESSGVVDSLLKEKGLMDLTDLFEETIDGQTEPLKDMFIPGIIGSNVTSPFGDGKIYLAPFNSGPMGLVYNKTLFDERGWEIPKTWDEFLALGEIVKNDTYMIDGTEVTGRALLAYQGIHPQYMRSFLFPAVAQKNGLESLTAFSNYEAGSVNTPEAAAYLNYLPQIASSGYLMEGTVALNHTQAQTDMMLGKAVFIPCGVWIENEMKDAPREEGFEFGMMAMPVMEEGDTQYVATSYEQFSIPVNAKNPEAAKEFLKFLYSDESIKSFAKYSNTVYARKDAKEVCAEYLSPGMYNMLASLDNATALPTAMASLPQGCKIELNKTLYHNHFTEVINGEMSVESWLDSIETDFAQIRADRENE
ncbi:MAG: carbohydrate ABC transporter substrate-binding protein [Lachnospiraceae bacterium]